ncbi:lysostaphin resistance A-like protein [Roseivirga sp. BDSF3-8]|uniref:CPBP family intramembrane glutamic endopeptidase n=1 Tax=Roseivirga sp. BDSF3-8 TaxID=3241598 RepID=UPI00353276F4
MNNQSSRVFPKPFESAFLFLLAIGLNFLFALIAGRFLIDLIPLEAYTWANHLFAYGLTVATGLFFYRKKGNSIRNVFKKNDFCWCMTGSIIILSLLAVILLWPCLVWLIPPGAMEMFVLFYTSRSIFLLPALLITGPILEEILFRGLILKGSLNAFSPFKAIAFSSLLFAFSHTTPPQLLSGLIVGGAIGWICYKTGSLIPGILAHVAFNFGNYILRFIYDDAYIEGMLRGTEGFISGVSWYIPWMVALLLTGGIGYYLYRQVMAHTYPLMDQ